MAWTVDYTATAKKQLRKLDGLVARRIVDFMDERVATKNGPRTTGKALTGPLLGAYWRIASATVALSVTFKTARFASW